MQVSDLQLYLSNLATALKVGKATSVHNDLVRVAEGLNPFSELSVAQFADFLRKAEEFDRTGMVSAKAKGASSRAAVDVEAVNKFAQETLSLLERVIDASVTYKDISAHVKKIGRLKAGEIKQVAREIGIPGSPRTKDAALNAIEELLSSKKQSAIMTRQI